MNYFAVFTRFFGLAAISHMLCRLAQQTIGAGTAAPTFRFPGKSASNRVLRDGTPVLGSLIVLRIPSRSGTSEGRMCDDTRGSHVHLEWGGALPE